MSRCFGRPPVYPFGPMDIGDVVTLDVPTSADVKRVCSNVSQYGLRHGRAYACKTDRATRQMTITRVR